MLADQITLLNETVLELLNEKDETKIVKAFTMVGLKVLDADFGFVWLNSTKSNNWELVYKSPKVPFTPNPPREGGRNYAALKNSTPDFVSDTKATPDAQYVSQFAKSFVILPLVYKDNVYGTMVLCFKEKENFPKEKRILSTFIGNSVAQAITIGRLVDSEHQARLQSEIHGAYFRALIENSDEAIFLVDGKGKIKYASPSIKKIFGHNPEEVIGKAIHDFIYKEAPEKISNFLEKTLKQTDTLITEFHYKESDGEIKTMEAKALNMTDNEHVGGIVLNVRDITEKKKSETLRETLVLLNEEKLKTEFIANATHEFRTPLAIIKGNIDLAMRLLKPSEIKPVKEELEAINAEVNHLSSLISDLALITYKMKAIKTMIAEDEIDLTKLIEDIAKRFKVIAGQKKISIRTRWEGSVYVKGDATYLSKLFLNLIKNSVSYGKVGGWVSVEISSNNESVEVRVKDDGVGIAEEDLPYVFDRFYRVDKARTGVEGGTGLGLAIVKWAVIAHGGSIKIDSKLGKGTTFIVTLPRLK